MTVPFTTRQKGSGDENKTPSPANGGMETSGYLVEHAPITASDPIKRWVDPPEKKRKRRAPRACVGEYDMLHMNFAVKTLAFGVPAGVPRDDE
jgi:hypothetical protein